MLEEDLKIEKLVIIGNGADLHCGLSSTFEDYINNKKDLLDELEIYTKDYKKFMLHIKNEQVFVSNEISVYIHFYKYILPIFKDQFDDKTLNNYKYIYNFLEKMDNDSYLNNNSIFDKKYSSKDTLNFWDLVIISDLKGSKPSWYDVEQLIKDFLVPKNKKDKSNAMLFDYLLKQVREDKNKKVYVDNPFIEEKVKLDFDPENIKSIFNNDEQLILFVISYLYLGMSNYNDIYEFLYTELNKFENSFGKYLKHEMELGDGVENGKNDKNTTLKYSINMANLFNILANKEPFNLFSFNYTIPILAKNSLIPKIQLNRFRNIHGGLWFNNKGIMSPIIIGIDENYNRENFLDDKVKNKIDRFTKTRRVMNINYQEDINNEHNEIFDKNIKEIIFYGHSLGDADYAYFQSIFDYYDIYHNNINILFAYSLHMSDEDARELQHDDLKRFNELNNKKMDEQNDKIHKLINDYGKTLENKYHGMNLLNAMLTFGRVKAINTIDINND